MKPRARITRKDVAELMSVSTEQVRKNELRWGLRAYRCDLNARCVGYRAECLVMLRAKGWVN